MDDVKPDYRKAYLALERDILQINGWLSAFSTGFADAAPLAAAGLEERLNGMFGIYQTLLACREVNGLPKGVGS